ncbi:DNA polymerase III subunit gamma/tau [Helicobacter sp. 11S02629-2]|uniref:DNA polymerase III subunit gamma/tau n=1 Tax=Helicobacter sp. 11S02629-2 TaxID=1476195 RepID=UPI000BA53BB2|nr:DNA polymerase III subunit gamma/tau [Helicobacter sp. 11S02629-2]PAF42146.1 DNA polymerase III, subunit gamma and tau [Helicobacter sp. 11S02629-2]
MQDMQNGYDAYEMKDTTILEEPIGLESGIFGMETTSDSSKIASKEASPANSTPLKDDTPSNVNLALKYRPILFSELIGQESVSLTLSASLDSNKISNAYLFSGLRGSGKTSSARIMARSLECEKGISSHPCGVCDNCVLALKGNHPDIIEIDGASNRKIDDIRDLIEQTKYRPSVGRFKIFIIDEVHMLTKEAFNALLKTLEEPPSYVKFILATTDPLKMPATILSRTQHYRFKKISNAKLLAHLKTILEKEKVSYEEEALNLILKSQSGSVRDVLTMLEQAIIYSKQNLSVEAVSTMIGALNPSVFDELFLILSSGDMQKAREFVLSVRDYEAQMVIDELAFFIKTKVTNLELPLELATRYLRIINDARYDLQNDSDSDFCLLLCVLRMCEASKVLDIKTAIARAEASVLKEASSKDSLESKPSEGIPSKLEVRKDATLSASSKDFVVSTSVKERAQSENLEQEASQKVDKALEEVEQKPTFLELPKDTRYVLFLERLSFKDAELGEIFENFIEYKSFEDGILELDNFAPDELASIIRTRYSGIKLLLDEVFGSNLKLKVNKVLAKVTPKSASIDKDLP